MEKSISREIRAAGIQNEESHIMLSIQAISTWPMHEYKINTLTGPQYSLQALTHKSK